MKIGSYGHTREKPANSEGWVIYHNPKCSKSREALDLLRANHIDPKVVEYLVDPLKRNQLEELLSFLNVAPKEIARTNERLFRDLEIDKEDREAILIALVKNPELMQRPIVVYRGKAVIARPAEKLLELME